MGGLAPRERVIVALDVPDHAALATLLDRLDGRPAFYKVGLELFIAEGERAIELVRSRGGRVFLDLKLHDIPETVARAVASAARVEAELLTVHTSGGYEMMSRAAEASRGRVKLLGVTVLTSLDAAALAQIGVSGTPAERVQAWARMCQDEGLDGVVASAQEAALIRAACGPEFVIVTPGIRPAGSAVGDQKRIATPASAIADGAHYLVVGRAITAAADPAAAARAVVAEMATALAQRD